MMCILSYSCLKVHEQNNYYLENPDSMSELICMSNVTCIFNSEARKVTNLIQQVNCYTI